MEINTKIIKIVQALGKDSNKLYWQVETSDGRMTCHEKDIIDELMEFVGGMCNLAVRQTPKKDGNGFWSNIIGIVQDNEGISYSKPKTQENTQTIPVLASKTNVEIEIKPINNVAKKVLDSHSNRPNTDVNCDVMCAKDIFICLMKGSNISIELNKLDIIMKESIELVKQARDSFS